MSRKLASGLIVAVVAALLSAPQAFATAIVVTFPSSSTGFATSADNTGFVSVASASGVTPSISGGAAGSMRVVVSATNSGLLRIPTTTNVSASSGYTLNQFNAGSNGLSTISFEGTVTNVSAALGSLQFRKTAAGSSSISVEVSQGGGLIYDNRYYEVISASLDWSTAFKTALTKTVPASDGLAACQGYLVTITSAQEQSFVFDKVRTQTWIALADERTFVNPAIVAYNAVTDPDLSTYADQIAAEGKFHWVAGPERGIQVTTGNSPNSSTPPPLAAGAYSNWPAGEPNNAGGSENGTQLVSNGNWNDLPHTGTTLATYVVEYGGIRVAAGHETNAANVDPTNAAHIGTKSPCIPAAAASAVTRSFTAVVAAVPGAPTNLTATAGSQAASLSWTAPASDGGSAITGYKIEANDGNGYVTAVANTGSTATTATISSLVVGTSYQFRVSAINLIGTSTASTASTAITILAGLPSAPTNISVSYPGTSAPISISWQAPVSNGGAAIASYVVEYQNGGSWLPLTASGLTSSVSSSLVSIDSRWLLRVAAVNSAGQGPWATWENQPPAPYSGPVFTSFGDGGRITSGSASNIVVSGKNLSMVTELFIGSSKLSFVRVGDQLSVSLPALTPGTYDIRAIFSGGGVITHQSAISVFESSPQVNVGSFNGKLVVYAQNLDGKRISWKVGGNWGKAVAVGNTLNRFDRLTPRKGVTVSVDIYVDGVKTLTKSVVTR